MSGEGEAPEDEVRRELLRNAELAKALDAAWTLIDPLDLVGDLFTVPAFLRHCAPHLTPEEVRLLQRDDPRAWTTSDLPLLDAARQRLGDPDAGRERRRQEAEREARREEMADVVDTLIEHDDSEMMLMSMLRGHDLQGALDEVVVPTVDELAGPFAHVVVDEAQELTDAEWQMVLSRCPSRSLTIVGDRAQSRAGFHEGWEERLGRVGLPGVRRASLTVNYRTPEEVMAEAEPVIRGAVPDANVPTSVRRSGIAVHHGSVDELDDVVAGCEGIGVVIGAPEFAGTEKVRSLTAGLAKGLEFDLVVIVDADALDPVDRYVAMTRATQRLVLLER